MAFNSNSVIILHAVCPSSAFIRVHQRLSVAINSINCEAALLPAPGGVAEDVEKLRGRVGDAGTILGRAHDRPGRGRRLDGHRARKPGVGDAGGDPPRLEGVDRDVVGEYRERRQGINCERRRSAAGT